MSEKWWADFDAKQVERAAKGLLKKPDFRPYEEKVQEAIQARLQAERAWMEFVLAVADGRISESFFDICTRVEKTIMEEEEAEKLQSPPNGGD